MNTEGITLKIGLFGITSQNPSEWIVGSTFVSHMQNFVFLATQMLPQSLLGTSTPLPPSLTLFAVPQI